MELRPAAGWHTLDLRGRLRPEILVEKTDFIVVASKEPRANSMDNPLPLAEGKWN